MALQKIQFIGGPLDGEWRKMNVPLPLWYTADAPSDHPDVAQYGLVTRQGRQLYMLTQLLDAAASGAL